MSDETIEVTLKLPKPPEGWSDPEWRVPNGIELYLDANDQWAPTEACWHANKRWCCRRIDDPWKPPAGAADGTRIFPCDGEWWATEGPVRRYIELENSWTAENGNAVPATIFRDFVPPKERRPYTVGKDC